MKTWRGHGGDTSGKGGLRGASIENSSAGVVAENYDLLMEYDVAIVGEQIIKIDHALLGVKGSCISDIRCVYSHPQALMQCASYLEREHPEFETISLKTPLPRRERCRRTGTEARLPSPGPETRRFTISRFWRRRSRTTNTTRRGLSLCPREKYLARADKISICFELPNEKGSLYHTLSHFIFNGLNMRRIESCPLPGRTGSIGSSWILPEIFGRRRYRMPWSALPPRPEDCGFWEIIERYAKIAVDTAERKKVPGDETFCFYLYRILRDYFEDFPGK